MKKIFSILLLFATLLSNATTYYISPSGNDGNPGTIGSPRLSLALADTYLVAGDILYVRGGTYTEDESAATEVQIRLSNLNGTITDSIIITNYPGESPIFDFSGTLHTPTDVYGLYIENSEYTAIRGIRFTGLAQNPSGNSLYGLYSGGNSNCKFERLEVDNIGGYGYMYWNSSNMLTLNCDVHHCGDSFTGWGGANGFMQTASSNTSTNNTWDGCRAWWISDDGWDFFNTGGTVTMRNCWSFWNGYQPGTFTSGGDGYGFKLGPGNGHTATIIRIVNTSVAFENRTGGFDQNYNSDNTHGISVENSTAYNNGSYGFQFQSGTVNYIIRNNASLGHTNNYVINGSSTQTTNSWQGGITLNSSDFTSVSSTGADGARNADGTLPTLTFLKLAASSDLINAGTEIGFGNDIGAYQYVPAGAPPATRRRIYRLHN